MLTRILKPAFKVWVPRIGKTIMNESGKEACKTIGVGVEH